MSSGQLAYNRINFADATLSEHGLEVSDQNYRVNHGGDNHCVSCFNNDDDSEDKLQISFRNILWSERSGASEMLDLLDVTYVDPSSLKSPEPAHIRLRFKGIDGEWPGGTDSAEGVNKKILKRAYKNGLLRPSVLVLINPNGGQGEARKIYKQKVLPILEASRAKISYMETGYHGHAVDIARDLNIDEFDIIACCSGDGIPHQVINGFHERPDEGLEAFNKVIVVQIPCGSGNAFSLSTFGSSDASFVTFLMLKAQRVKLDLMAVTQGIGAAARTNLSFLTQCFGAIADSDIGTEHLRWMGPIRFDLGVLHKVLKRASYPCDIYVKYVAKTKQEISSHFHNHLYQSDDQIKVLAKEDFKIHGTGLDQSPPDDWEKIPERVTKNLSIFYVGKLPYVSKNTQFFPAALPDDNAMDLVITDNNSSYWETLSNLLKVSKGTHIHGHNIIHAKVSAYRLVPKLKDPRGHYISIDGEDYPFEQFQVSVLPGVLTTLAPEGSFVNTYYTK